MRVLVVEDEPSLAALLRGALEQGGFATDTAATAAEADDFLRLAGYDAAILDLGLPDGDGLALLRKLRRAGNNLPVLILTARDAPEDKMRGLDTGADDYVVKPFHLGEILSRIRALLRRPNAALGVRLDAGNLVFDTPTRSVEVSGVALPLPARETTLLEMLLRRQGRVIAREALESGLYGFDTPTGPNAMEVAMHRLRRRLQEAGATVRVQTVRGVGYMLTVG
jgi:DNA-binding response OmpR family regulator